MLELLGCGAGVGGGHEGAYDCDAVEGLCWRGGLVQDSLHVGGVYAADADGLDVGVGLGEGGEDGLDAGCADDGLGVLFAVWDVRDDFDGDRE